MRPLIFGEVLFDRFPDGSVVLGGAPFNVAWHLQAFGLAPLVISRVGRDALGEAVIAAMTGWGMDRSGVQFDATHPTGTVEVAFQAGEPHYAIADRVAYDFIAAEELPAPPGEWLLYHGSLALRHTESARALARLRDRIPGPRFVDVNLRMPWWRREQVLADLEGATWVKLSEGELTALFPDGDGAGRRAQLVALVADHVVITSGEQGATAVSADGAPPVRVRPTQTAAVLDTVGAGDAFCSVCLAGRLLAWPLAETMQRAQQFAGAIVGIRGATPTDKDFYRRFLDAWRMKAD